MFSRVVVVAVATTPIHSVRDTPTSHLSVSLSHIHTTLTHSARGMRLSASSRAPTSATMRRRRRPSEREERTLLPGRRPSKGSSGSTTTSSARSARRASYSFVSSHHGPDRAVTDPSTRASPVPGRRHRLLTTASSVSFLCVCVFDYARARARRDDSFRINHRLGRRAPRRDARAMIRNDDALVMMRHGGARAPQVRAGAELDRRFDTDRRPTAPLAYIWQLHIVVK